MASYKQVILNDSLVGENLKLGTSAGNDAQLWTNNQIRLNINGSGTTYLYGSLILSGNRTISTQSSSHSLSINPQANLILGSDTTDHIYIGNSGINISQRGATTFTGVTTFTNVNPIIYNSSSFNGTPKLILKTAGSGNSHLYGGLMLKRDGTNGYNSQLEFQTSIYDNNLRTMMTLKSNGNLNVSGHVNATSRMSIDNVQFGSYNIGIWNEAYSWGDHSTQGYITTSDTAPVANIANRLGVYDTRSNLIPPYNGGRLVRFDFKSNSTDGLNDGSVYHGVMQFNPWSDSSGGKNHQMGFTANNNIYVRVNSNDSTWGSWSRLAHASEIPSLSGYATLSDPTFVTRINTPQVRFTDSSKTSFNHLNVAQWHTAYSWGNHASAGYATDYGDPRFTSTLKTRLDSVAMNADVTPSWVPNSDPGYLTELPKNVVFQPSRVAINAGDSRYKISLWGGTTYGIGMHSGIQLGAVSDYAMTFQMNNQANRGFWWGHSNDNLATHGAMSLTTDGRLYVADQIQVGRGRGHTSELNSIYTAEFYGHTLITSGNLYIDGQGIGGSDVQNFKTAYGWGNHASAGYLTSHQDISGKASLSGATFTGHVDVASSTPFLYVGDGTSNNDGSWDSNIMLDSNQTSRIRVEQRADNKNLEIYAHTGQNPRIRAADSATGLILGVGSTVCATIGTNPYLTVHGETTLSGNLNSKNIINSQQYLGGFGAVTTAGTQDWNDSSNARSGSGYTLLDGRHTNGPSSSGGYYHPFSFEYYKKDGTGNMTQMAIPYLNGNFHFRSRYNGTWTAWRTMIDSGNISLFADKTPSWVPSSDPNYVTPTYTGNLDINGHITSRANVYVHNVVASDTIQTYRDADLTIKNANNKKIVFKTNNLERGSFYSNGTFVLTGAMESGSHHPSNNNTVDLGHDGARWRQIHTNLIYVNGRTLSGNTVDNIGLGITAHGYGNHADAGYYKAGSTLNIRSIDNTGSYTELNDLAITKKLYVGFGNGVANQKANIIIPNTLSSGRFWGEIIVTINSGYSYENASGILKVSYALGLNHNGAQYTNTSMVMVSEGETPKNFALDDQWRWDSTNLNWYLPIAHLKSTGNQAFIQIEAKAIDTQYLDSVKNATVSSVYTTDTNVFRNRGYEYNNSFNIKAPNLLVGSYLNSEKFNNIGSTANGISIAGESAPTLSLWDTSSSGFHSHVTQVGSDMTIRSCGTLSLQVSGGTRAMRINSDKSITFDGSIQSVGNAYVSGILYADTIAKQTSGDAIAVNTGLTISGTTTINRDLNMRSNGTIISHTNTPFQWYNSANTTQYGQRFRTYDSGNGGYLTAFGSQRVSTFYDTVVFGNGSNSSNPSLEVKNGLFKCENIQTSSNAVFGHDIVIPNQKKIRFGSTDGTTRIYGDSSNNLMTFVTNQVERVRINDTGLISNSNIYTNSIQHNTAGTMTIGNGNHTVLIDTGQLDLRSSGDAPRLKFVDDNGTNCGSVYAHNGNEEIGFLDRGSSWAYKHKHGASGHHQWRINNAQRMFLDNDEFYVYPNGTVMLGVTTDGVRAYGTVTATGGNSTNWNTAYGWGDHSRAGYSTGKSDIRLKKDVKTVDKPLEKLSKLRGVDFTWKDTDKKGGGVIAQEVNKVLPDLVEYNVDVQANTVDYNGLIGVLIESVKELRNEVEILKAKCNCKGEK